MTRAIVGIVVLVCLSLALPQYGFAQASCTRAELQSAVENYLAAQRAGNPASLRLAASAKYIENTQPSTFDKGILKSALKTTRSGRRD